MRRLIDDNLPYSRLEEASIPLHVTATDVRGAATLLSRGPAADAILASTAIPGVFPLVWIDGQALMDGAIAANTPIGFAANLGATRIVVLPTGYACDLKEPPKGAIANVLHAITLLISWQLIRDLETLSGEVDVFVAPALCPLDVSPFDFSASCSLIERAAASTEEWVACGGLTRRSLPQDLGAHRQCQPPSGDYMECDDAQDHGRTQP